VKLCKSISCGWLVWGVAQLLDRIYAICHEVDVVIVRDATTFKRLPDIRLRVGHDMVVMDLVAGKTNQCLYIYDNKNGSISRLGYDGENVIDWLKVDCAR